MIQKSRKQKIKVLKVGMAAPVAYVTVNILAMISETFFCVRNQAKTESLR